MNIRITDTDTGRELWTVQQCATHCGVTDSTWRSYSRANNKLGVPEPVTRLTKQTPLWDAEAVKTWHANRPGSPIPNSPSPTTDT